MVSLNVENPIGTLTENQFGDHYLFSVNRKNFEKIDYQTKFLQEFDDTFDKEDTLYIITGTDSGMMVRQLLQTPPMKGSAYVFIEFPEIIELTKDLYNLNEHNRIIVTTEEHWQEDAKKIGLQIYYTINKVKLIKSFAAQYYYISEYLFLQQVIDDINKHLNWQYQAQLGGKIFIQRQLENLTECHTPAILLENYFHGKSAIILAGGPSLDDHIDWIEKNQEYFVVIAVSRISRRLLQTKIKPDIIVSVDPHPPNFSVSKEIFNFEKESLLVHQSHLSPMLLGNWLGNNLYLGELFPWKTKQNKINLTGIGPTVTNTAIQLAINMGIKQQLLFGVDLCFSPDGYTHAKGSNEHNVGPKINTISKIVITNKGEQAETNSAYFEAIQIIEHLAKLAKTHNGILINPSMNSAKMNSVEHISINEIAINKEKVNISNFLQNHLGLYKQSNLKVKHYQNILKELNITQVKIKRIKELADKGLEYNKRFFANDNPTGNFKFKFKLDRLEKELNHKDLSQFSELSKRFGMNNFLHFLNPDNDRDWTNEEIKHSGDTYYKALRSGASLLNKHIFTAINKVELRLLEHNKLTIDNKLIKRHLDSFKQSCLFDEYITIRNDGYVIIQKDNNQDIIKECKNLYTRFKSNNIRHKKTDKDQIQALSFYLLMLQNEQNYQTRRLYIITKENSSLLLLPENNSILDESPISFIQRQMNINSIIQAPSQQTTLIKKQNQLVNLSDNHSPCIVLKNYFKEKSALILIDEVSLNKNITWIEANQEYYIVIALTSLAEDLLNTEIKPDIFLATEAYENNFEKHKAIIHFEHHSILINQNYLLPELLGNWLGVNFYIGNLLPWEHKLNIENFESKNSSDMLTAILFTSYMGINQQILFVNDKNSITEKISELDKLLEVRGIKLSTPSPAVIDNKHISPSKLNEIISPKERVSILDFLKNQKGTLDNTEYRASHYKLVLDESNKLYGKLTIIQDIIEQIINYKHQVLIETKSDIKKQIHPKINKLEKELKQKHLANLISLSKEFSGNDLIISMKNENSFYPLLKTEIYQFSRQVFTAIIMSETRLLELNQLKITESLVKRHLSNQKLTLLDNKVDKNSVLIDRRQVLMDFQNGKNLLGKNIDERVDSVSLYMILNQHQLNKQERRLIFIENYRNDLFHLSDDITILGKHIKEIINKQSILFNLMFNRNTSDDQDHKLEGLEIKLYNLFTLKEKNPIKKIIKGIELIEEKNTENNPYYHLAQGYYFELKDDFDRAIEEYGYANHPNTIESALKRLVFISLKKGDLESAYNILNILSEISPEYLPQLAELNIITKNYKDALDIYSRYLDDNPSDIAILLKVGQIYEAQNVFDGAQFIYKQILEVDPGNLIAQERLKDIMII